MVARKTENETGAYIDNESQRWDLSTGTTGYPREAWTHFDSLEECLETWGLTYDPLPEPQPEN